MIAVVLTAAADSVLTVSGRIPPSDWIRFQESWHEFFLMAGTAAVTLAGLLFVAISIHVDALVHESRQHLLSLARLILFSYVGVMVLSLMMLVPALPFKITAVELVVVPIPLIAWTLRFAGEQHGPEHAEFSRAVLRRRTVMPLVGYAMIMASGLLMWRLRVPEFFYWLVGAVCMLLGNAAGASWDLLVRTARMRRHDELHRHAEKKADVG